MVAPAEPGETVWPLQEFVSDAHAPLRSDGRKTRERTQMHLFGIVPANHHRKRIFKAERLHHLQMKFLRIKFLHAIVNVRGSTLRRLVQDSGQRRARVFHVQIQVAGKQRFVHQQRAAEVGLANHRDACLRFNVLRQEFGKYNLLRKKLGADRDPGL